MLIENLQLKTPYAFDENNNIVSINSASKMHCYTCISCNKNLILKDGKIKTKHFAHKNINCSTESILHFILKNSVCTKLTENKNSLKIFHHCCNSYLYHKKQEISFNIPIEFDDVKVEFKLENGYIPDVVCLKNNKPVFVIEIFHTHKVDKDKHKNLGIPYIEISTKDYLEDILNNDGTVKNIEDFLKTFTKLKVTSFNMINMLCDDCLKRKENLIRSMHTHNKLVDELKENNTYPIKSLCCKHSFLITLTKEYISLFQKYYNERKYPNFLLVKDKTNGKIVIVTKNECFKCSTPLNVKRTVYCINTKCENINKKNQYYDSYETTNYRDFKLKNKKTTIHSEIDNLIFKWINEEEIEHETVPIFKECKECKKNNFSLNGKIKNSTCKKCNNRIEQLKKYKIYKNVIEEKGRLNLKNAISAKYDFLNKHYIIKFPCIITQTKTFKEKIFHLKIKHYFYQDHKIIYFKRVDYTTPKNIKK